MSHSESEHLPAQRSSEWRALPTLSIALAVLILMMWFASARSCDAWGTRDSQAVERPGPATSSPVGGSSSRPTRSEHPGGANVSSDSGRPSDESGSESGPVLRGVIRDAVTGECVDGAAIDAFLRLASGEVRLFGRTVSDSGGTFEVLGLEPDARVKNHSERAYERTGRVSSDGSFSITAARSEFPLVLLIDRGGRLLCEERVLEEPMSSNVVDVELRADSERFGEVAVRALGTGRRELRYFDLVLRGEASGRRWDVGRSFLDAQGPGRIVDVVPGVYSLEVRAPGYRPRTIEFVTVRAGTSDLIEVELERE